MPVKSHSQMAADDATQQERRGSLLVDPTLASEEDAAVLAKMGCVQFHDSDYGCS